MRGYEASLKTSGGDPPCCLEEAVRADPDQASPPGPSPVFAAAWLNPAQCGAAPAAAAPQPRSISAAAALTDTGRPARAKPVAAVPVATKDGDWNAALCHPKWGVPHAALCPAGASGRVAEPELDAKSGICAGPCG